MTTKNDILVAQHPKDIFGLLTPGDPMSSLKTKYRAMSLAFHPDTDTSDPELNAVFARLSDFYHQAINLVETNSYDVLISFSTPKSKYNLTHLIGQASWFSFYLGNNSTDDLLFLVSRYPSFNAYMQSCAENLRLCEDVKSTPLISFTGTLEDEAVINLNGFHHAVVVVRNAHPGPLNDYVPITKILSHYPDGIDIRDVAWIFRRLLDAIGFAHAEGNLLNNALTPNDILIGLNDTHHVWIPNWSVASPIVGSPLPFVDDAFKHCYPPEIIDKQAASLSSDIYMLAATMYELVEKTKTPRQFLGFFQSLTYPNPSHRPNNAFRVREEFTVLLDKFYKREYRPLALT